MEPFVVVLTDTEVAQVLRDYVAAKFKLEARAVEAAHVRVTWRENGPAAVAMVLPPSQAAVTEAR